MTVHSVPGTLCEVGAQPGYWGRGHENEYKCKHSQKRHSESFSIPYNLTLFLFKYEKKIFFLNFKIFLGGGGKFSVIK